MSEKSIGRIRNRNGARRDGQQPAGRARRRVSARGVPARGARIASSSTSAEREEVGKHLRIGQLSARRQAEQMPRADVRELMSQLRALSRTQGIRHAVATSSAASIGIEPRSERWNRGSAAPVGQRRPLEHKRRHAIGGERAEHFSRLLPGERAECTPPRATCSASSRTPAGKQRRTRHMLVHHPIQQWADAMLRIWLEMLWSSRAAPVARGQDRSPATGPAPSARRRPAEAGAYGPGDA